MEFEWDDAKRIANISKHGLDFVDAEIVFSGPLIVAAARCVDGESRSLAVGMFYDIHVTMIYTLRGSTVRIISMRRARHEERKRYDDKLQGRIGRKSGSDKEPE
jgi:uncharacterized DUF497 family protein